MRELLFIAHRFPYPPDKGEKIRAWHFLQHLAATRRVHLACLADRPVEPAHLAAVRAICDQCHLEPLEGSPLQWRNLSALLSGQPITCSHFHRPKLAQWIKELLAQRPIEGIFAYSGAMAQYVPGAMPEGCTRILDFVDVDSDKWRLLAQNSSWPRAWIYAREARLLCAYEHEVAGFFDTCLFVSESEAALFRETGPRPGTEVVAIENGVEAVQGTALKPPKPDGVDGQTLVFVGTMDYWPNVDAVTWYAREIHPLVRQLHPDATFAVVGASPSRAVERLGALAGVRVVGAVESVLPYLAHSAAAVIPLRVSPGVANKVLEAMSMAKPVVATTAAIEGLRHVAPERHILTADDPAGFAAQVSRLLSRPSEAEALGEEARRCVQAHYTWQSSYEKLDRLLKEGAPSAKAGVA